jgi:chromosomal replication initiator protein
MRPRPTIASIKATVAARYGVDPKHMTSPLRRWDVSHPRQVAMFLARKLTRHTMPYIGRHFGGRHHTTVLHACRAVEQRRATDRKLARQIRKTTSRVMRVAP